MMDTDAPSALVRRQRLGPSELAAIRTLAEECNAFDDLDMKLNWDMLQTRSGAATEDFLWYQEGILIGYLALYGFGRPELEVSGMIRPAYRRQGIFRRLYDAARAEAMGRGIESLLLICEPGSSGGSGFVHAAGAQHVFSEHKMEIAAPTPVTEGAAPINLEPVTVATGRIVAGIYAASFGSGLERAEHWAGEYIDQPDRRAFLARLDGTPVGTIAVQSSPEEAFIYGFGVVPERRGQGYGRQILAMTINQLMRELPTRPIMLEVETENRRALGLYESCGFRRVRTYDYWRVALAV